MLPFETEPAQPETVLIGTPETGTFRVRKYKKLGLSEYLLLKRYTKDLPDLQMEAVKLAEAIASKTGKPVLELFNSLTSGDTSSLGNNLKEVLVLRQLMDADSLARTPALATVILKYRVLPPVIKEARDKAETLRAGLKDKQLLNREELERELKEVEDKISHLESWGMEETCDPNKIHPELVEVLADFASKEQNGWERLTEATEDDLKKLSSEEAPENLTGQISTGEFNGFGPVTPDLVLNASDSSLQS